MAKYLSALQLFDKVYSISFPVLQYHQDGSALSSSSSSSDDPNGFSSSSPGEAGGPDGNGGYAYTTSCLVKGEQMREKMKASTVPENVPWKQWDNSVTSLKFQCFVREGGSFEEKLGKGKPAWSKGRGS